MTPDEAKETLLNAGVFSKWEARCLTGGSTYKPGNPGVFEGLRFRITLVEPGVCTAEFTDFENVTTELQVKPNLGSLAGEHQKDLAWAVQSVLDELWDRLDRTDRGVSPKVPLSAAVELCREFPTATTEGELLGQLMLGEDGSLRRLSLALTHFRPAPRPAPGPGLTEQERLATIDLRAKPEATEAWVPPIRGNPSQSRVAAPSKNAVSYGLQDGVSNKDTKRRQRRDFHWAPLASKDSWPTVLRPVPPFDLLSVAREMSVVLFMSAVRQVLDDTPEWLELIAFSTEPVEGKVTACFLATKVDPPRTEKPQWLKHIASPAERATYQLEGQLSKG